MLIKLGLNDEATLPKLGPDTQGLPPPEPVSALEEAVRQLESLEPALAKPAFAPEAAAVEDAVPEDAAEAVVYWLARYSGNPSAAVRHIRELAAKAPERVVETVLPLYQAGRLGEATRFMASVLIGDNSTAAKLCDPATSLDGSVGVVKALTLHEPTFDARFAKSLLNDDTMTEAARQRGLQVLEKLGSGGRLIPILIQFLRDPDSRIRSKAALMFGQIMSAQGIMERLLRDEDARVRANFVEGLWTCAATDHCRRLFRLAVKDPNHRVAGNALVGLHRLGENLDVVRHLGKMARSPEAPFRAAAAWVMGQTREGRYTSVLRQMVRDPDSQVRFNALRALRRINLSGVRAAPPPPPDTPVRLGLG
jgi:hypothetical protein